MQVCSVSKTADAAQNGTLTLLRGKELSCHLSPSPLSAAKKDGQLVLFRLLPTPIVSGKPLRRDSIRWLCDVSAAA